MFRLRGLPPIAGALTVVLLTTGCAHQIYRETYSPHRSYFVAPKEKPIELPLDKKTTTERTAVVSPDAALLPPAGGATTPPPAPPPTGIPGLDLTPAPAPAPMMGM